MPTLRRPPPPLLVALLCVANANTPEPHHDGSGHETPAPAVVHTPEPHGSGHDTPEPEGSGHETPAPEPHGSGHDTPEPEGSGHETPAPGVVHTPEPHGSGHGTPEPAALSPAEIAASPAEILAFLYRTCRHKETGCIDTESDSKGPPWKYIFGSLFVVYAVMFIAYCFRGACKKGVWDHHLKNLSQQKMDKDLRVGCIEGAAAGPGAKTEEKAPTNTPQAAPQLVVAQATPPVSTVDGAVTSSRDTVLTPRSAQHRPLAPTSGSNVGAASPLGRRGSSGTGPPRRRPSGSGDVKVSAASPTLRPPLKAGSPASAALTVPAPSARAPTNPVSPQAQILIPPAGRVSPPVQVVVEAPAEPLSASGRGRAPAAGPGLSPTARRAVAGRRGLSVTAAPGQISMGALGGGAPRRVARPSPVGTAQTNELLVPPPRGATGSPRGAGQGNVGTPRARSSTFASPTSAGRGAGADAPDTGAQKMKTVPSVLSAQSPRSAVTAQSLAPAERI